MVYETGDFRRLLPVGGIAKGIPRKLSMLAELVPTTTPAVKVTVGLASAPAAASSKGKKERMMKMKVSLKTERPQE